MTKAVYLQKKCAWCGISIKSHKEHFGLGGLLTKNASINEVEIGDILRSVIVNVKRVTINTQTYSLSLVGKRATCFLLPSNFKQNRLELIFFGCSGECAFELKQALEKEKPINVEKNLWVISSYGL